jgi:uncharacterized metal-binding protein
MNPDQDVNNGNYSFSLVRKRFGNIIAWLYELYWKPYALFVSHRSFISHSPIISTVIRFIYVFWFPMFLLYYYSIDINWLWTFSLFMGVALMDLLHIMLDYI